MTGADSMFLIRVAGTGIAFPCAASDTITRAALRAGVPLLYECNTGSCGSCKVELVSGGIDSLRPDSPALTERDRGKHRILGCQARPTSDCAIEARVDPAAALVAAPRPIEATLTGFRDLTHDLREFDFGLRLAAPFDPGQYALLHLPGVAVGRAYSMSNTAGRACWQFQIKRVPGGVATGVLFDRLQVGDRVVIDGPYGHAYLRTDAPRDVVCIAGGSGLAPVLSIARGVAEAPALHGRHVHFFYGGRTPQDICGEDLLAEVPGLRGRHTYIPVVSAPELIPAGAWRGHTGFVHEAAARVLGHDLSGYEYYFAGPPPMALAVQQLLMQAKVPHVQMHFDRFF